VRLLQQGLPPREIARERDVTLETILGYLETMIGRGKIRRSDVYYSIPERTRRAISSVMKDGRSRTKDAVAARLQRQRQAVHGADIEVVLRFWSPPHPLGEMYEYLREIEVGLHNLIRCSLEAKFGPSDAQWWKLGVPESVRGECGKRRESEALAAGPHPFCYTDLLDLRTIMERNWGVFSERVPSIEKKLLMSDLVRLNEIRRVVMHPVRGTMPTDDDFDLVWSLRIRLGLWDPSEAFKR
jgi:hypothetical protein